jgi:hypothetical protein
MGKKIIKANDADNCESIMITLTREKYPIAFKAKLEELIEEGAFETEDEAIKWIESNPIELEIYYEKGSGLFAVESEAVESNGTYSPYTKAEIVCD